LCYCAILIIKLLLIDYWWQILKWSCDVQKLIFSHTHN
jgi:hypothetical protein